MFCRRSSVSIAFILWGRTGNSDTNSDGGDDVDNHSDRTGDTEDY